MIAARRISGYLVVDPDDDPERSTFLSGLGSRDRGCVVATCRTGTRTLTWVAKTIAEALGKRDGYSSIDRNELTIWQSASAWLVGEGVSDLVVNRAHLLNAHHWKALLELAAVNNISLWFVVQQPALARGLREAARDWQVETVSWEEFEDRWPRREPTGRLDDERLFPLVPDDDFLTFLATAHEVLERSDAVVVEDEFDRAFEATRRSIRSTDDRSEWAATLRVLVEEGASYPQALTRLRAAQAALFLDGVWLRADTRLFRFRRSGARAATVTEASADRLRVYLNPLWAAIAAIRLATGCNITELAALNLGDVVDGSDGRVTISVQGRPYVSPEDVVGIIRSHLASRADDGATDSDPLFATRRSRSSEPIRCHEHGIRSRLRQMSAESGLELLEALERRSAEEPLTWLKRHGLAFVELKEADV